MYHQTGINTNPLKQLLVGFSSCVNGECPTNKGTDRVFDAETASSQSSPAIEFYSLNNLINIGTEPHLAIQGRNITTFSNTSAFQLGYNLNATLAATIASQPFTFTATADGMFAPAPNGTKYYIKDTNFATGISTINEFPYTVTLTTASDVSRFQIVFGPVLKVVTSQCNTTLPAIGTLIYTGINGTNVVPSASRYRWEIIRQPDGLSYNPTPGTYKETILRSLSLDDNSAPSFLWDNGFYKYNTSYSIRCSFKDNNTGVWSPFGPACIITTPIPMTQVQASQCNNYTLPSFFPSSTNKITANIASFATGYLWRITKTNPNPGQPITIQTGLRVLTAYDINYAFPNFLSSFSQYCIEVAVVYNGMITPTFGTSCCINTGASRNANQNSTIIAYPNPTKSEFNIDLSTIDKKEFNIRIYNMMGVLIESKKATDLKNNIFIFGNYFTKGIYNVIIESDDLFKSVLVIKE